MKTITPVLLMKTVTPVLHPLQSLTAEEISKFVAFIRREKGLPYNTTRFVSIVLKEPTKAEVARYANGGEAPARATFAVIYDSLTGVTHEVTALINEEQIIKWNSIDGVQPTMTADEQIECEEVIKNDPAFAEALKKHGVTNPELVMIDIWTAGNYGAEEESNLRLARPLCFVRSDETDNGYARPIEGLRPVVDLRLMKLIRIEDYGYTPLPQQSANYRADRVKTFRADIKPLEISQPEGPSFTVNGYEVAWQKWNFVVGFNSREGLVLHNITYNDEGNVRSILYRASLSEMVVPYGDPTSTQKRKNAFDTGEYGMGQCANSLTLGCDCLGYIHYLDAVMNNSRGEIVTIGNAICMHEEDYGILWKHTDRRDGKAEVRRSRRLVISSVSTVENYEYGFFWYLYQDGNIQFEIKLTGILSLGTLPEGVKSKYGTLVAPQVYAPNHQHFFNMRLDFDLDGESNSVYELDVVAEEEGEGNPFENAFYAKATLLDTEKNARRKMNLPTARTWKIVNPNSKNALGEPVGYKLMPGDNCFPFANERTSWYRRAGFVQNHLWVTPFEESEMFAAGDYPNQHQGGDGLIKWTEQDRNVADQDIVIWYTMGHTHIPRMEDYPVMPTAYIGFLLKPNGFFTQNPANDVPPSVPQKAGNAAPGPSCCH
ncbi:primary-amine oxidase [Dyadobacter pollutisoli]|uniref:Amine oxidase n=1 Tax=Dyadobacter pollutisoli TaxID=2910158 RepID=A0A9E8SMJ3_9BACT|nr:primary-amine oxidase [Dyadobacter pollutisoli]WAC13379.1 primary-amine oxidase [Dyadobacter pollutisoli]